MKNIAYIFNEIFLSFIILHQFLWIWSKNKVFAKNNFFFFNSMNDNIIYLKNIFFINFSDEKGLKFFKNKNYMNFFKLRRIVLEKDFSFYMFLYWFGAMIIYLYQFFYVFDIFSDIYFTCYFFNNMYIIDNFSIFFKFLLSFFCSIFFLCSLNFYKYWKYFNVEFILLIHIACLMMLLLISSNDIFLIYLVIEIQTVVIVILCSIQISSRRSIEAGLKYFLLSAFFSCIFLFSMSLFYFVFGIMSLDSIFFLIKNNVIGAGMLVDNLVIISIYFLIIVIIFKLGLIPFHFWIADVYQGSNLIITFFLAILSKIGVLSVLSRFNFFTFFFLSYNLSFIFYFIGILSIFGGALLAYNENNIKRFFGYSGITNIGYICLAFSLYEKSGLVIGIFFFFIYLFSNMSFFFFILGIHNNRVLFEKYKLNYYKDINSDLYFYNNLDDFKGFYKKHRFLSFLILLNFLNLLGIPPFIFFWAKFSLFFEFLVLNNYFLCFIVILGSFISAFYYLRILKYFFFERSVSQKIFFFSDKVLSFLFVLFVFLSFFLGLIPYSIFFNFIFEFINFFKF